MLDWNDKWADFGVTLVATAIGVGFAQWLANVVRRDQLSADRADRIKKLETLLENGLKASLLGVWHAVLSLRRRSRAPGSKIPLGFIESQADNATELFDDDQFTELVACGFMIGAINDQLDVIRNLDLRLVEERANRAACVAGSVDRLRALEEEHARQIDSTHHAMAGLEERLEKLLLQLFPDAEKELLGSATRTDAHKYPAPK